MNYFTHSPTNKETNLYSSFIETKNEIDSLLEKDGTDEDWGTEVEKNLAGIITHRASITSADVIPYGEVTDAPYIADYEMEKVDLTEVMCALLEIYDLKDMKLTLEALEEVKWG